MRIATAQDAAALLSPFFDGSTGESVLVLHMDAERRLLGLTHEAAGAIDEVELPIAAVVGSALKLGAAALIVAHNHPSGDPTPSRGDVEATARLAAAARLLGIDLVDHLVFAGGAWRSLRALGTL